MFPYQKNRNAPLTNETLGRAAKGGLARPWVARDQIDRLPQELKDLVGEIEALEKKADALNLPWSLCVVLTEGKPGEK